MDGSGEVCRLLTPRRVVLVDPVCFCEPGFDHRGPWEPFRKVTEEEEEAMASALDYQRRRFMAMASMDSATWLRAGMTLGLEQRLAFRGEDTHERCEWCGFVRVLRFFIHAFDRFDFPIRHAIHTWSTT